MLHRLASTVTATGFVICANIATAQAVDPDKGAALFEALGLPDMLSIMRDEGIAYGDEIGVDLFQDRVNTEWTEIVSTIYDVDRMRAQVAAELNMALEGSDIDALLDFFSSEPGQSIIALEVSARRALLDDAVEEASKEAAAIAMEDQSTRYMMVRNFIEVNDLVETNVVGAMNSNYAFYIGLMDGGAFPAELTEEQVLTDVWSQEDEIRTNTTEWVFSFLMMAYQPLSDEDLFTYTAFSETEAGEDLNAAMFAAFDAMFEDISRQLGLASAQFMIGDEI
mgnify:CR=1 FL=1